MDIFGRYCARRYGPAAAGGAEAIHQADSVVNQQAMDLSKINTCVHVERLLVKVDKLVYNIGLIDQHL